MRHAGRRPTLSTIAGKTGLSVATISKVLNGRGDVAPETRERVEAELQAQGYTRRTRGRGGEYVELVMHELESSWAMDVVSGVHDVAAVEGLAVSVVVSGDRHAPGEEWLSGVLQRAPVGVVLVFAGLGASAQHALRMRDVAFAIIDPAGDPPPDVPSVGAANWSGALAATRHLVELGHRRIAMVTGPRDLVCSRSRLDGYRSAMSEAGIEVREEWIAYGDFGVEAGERHGTRILAMEDPPSAVFAGNDLQAVGVMTAARRRGLRVPEDVSVIGFDDIPLARLTYPPLTTVYQPVREMAAEATRIVAARGAEGHGGTRRVELATTLVRRGTTAPPPDPVLATAQASDAPEAEESPPGAPATSAITMGG